MNFAGILFRYLSSMLHSFFVNSLLEEQLDEEDIKAAVEDRGHCVGQVKIGILAFRTWKD